MPTATIPATVVLRSRPATSEPGVVHCGECHEVVRHDGAIWRHVRTGLSAHWNDKQCRPLCDWPDCTVAAAASNVERVWSGHGFEWRAKHFLCADHRAEYQRTVGATVHT